MVTSKIFDTFHRYYNIVELIYAHVKNAMLYESINHNTFPNGQKYVYFKNITTIYLWLYSFHM